MVFLALVSEYLKAISGFYFISLFVRERKLLSLLHSCRTKAQVNLFNCSQSDQEAEFKKMNF